jgi:hypothetical protein
MRTADLWSLGVGKRISLGWGHGTSEEESRRAITADETCSFTSQARRRRSLRLSGVDFAVIFAFAGEELGHEQ